MSIDPDSVSLPPPPACISRDEYKAADSARQRLAPKSHLTQFISLPNLRYFSFKKPMKPIKAALDTTETMGSNLINLDSSNLDDSEEYTDKYEWAIVYENQRGLTMFSIPYYSRLSLLPSDPPPFTIPNVSSRRSKQPPAVTLANYPLPDGTWRWVSKCWMIDMRSDSGEVQHDGFEYNWMFRAHKWRAEVGSLSTGGWVRRRRWIRLMMRPGKHPPHEDLRTPTIDYDHNMLDGIMDIWLNNDVALNWTKCHTLMKRLGRDGRKLELWKLWLSPHYQSNPKGKAKQEQLSDSFRRLRSPPKEYLIPFFRIHGVSLMRTFIYPDSRAKFINMLGLAGILPELDTGLGTNEMDFWSYTNVELCKFKI